MTESPTGPNKKSGQPSQCLPVILILTETDGSSFTAALAPCQ